MKRYLEYSGKFFYLECILYEFFSVSSAVLSYGIGALFQMDFSMKGQIYSWLLFLCAASAVTVGLHFAVRWAANRKQYDFYVNVRDKIWNTLFQMDKRSLEQLDEVQCRTMIDNDIVMLYEAWLMPLTDLIKSVCMLFTYWVMLLFINGWLALAVFLCSLGCGIIPQLTGEKYANLREAHQRALNTMNRRIQDVLENVVFSDPRVSVRLKKYGDEGIEATGLCLLKYGRYRTACITGIKFWTNLMLFCVLCVLVVLYGNDLIAAGFFLTGFEAYEVCGDKAGFIARNWSDIQSAGKTGIRIADFIDRRAAPEMLNFEQKAADFCKNILWQSGVKYKLSGKNGSGKTICMRYMYHFWPDAAYMPQSTCMFPAGLWENITLFGVSSKSYIEPLVLEIFRSRPDLFQVHDCTILSEGEKQMIGLLRTLAMNQNWILLDEPFSNLKPEYARLCIQKWEPWIRGKGMVITDHTGYLQDTWFDQVIQVCLKL